MAFGPAIVAHAGQDVAFAVVAVLRGHGAVQGQHHHVHRHGVAQVREQLVAQPLVGRPDDPSARLGEGADALRHAPAARLGALAPDAQLVGAVVDLLARRVAVREEGLLEALIAGGDRREGVGLGIDAGNEDFHPGTLGRLAGAAGLRRTGSVGHEHVLVGEERGRATGVDVDDGIARLEAARRTRSISPAIVLPV